MPFATAPPLPTARAAHALVATRGALWVLGGSGGQVEVDRFDGHRWTAATRLPAGGLNAPAAVALGGRIWLIGGFEQQTNLPTAAVHVYDPGRGSWTSAPPLPAPRGGATAVVLDGRIHVLGGGNSAATIADHSVYDPRTKRWRRAAPLPRAEGSVAAVVFGGRIWAIGGRSGASDFGDVYVYDAAHDRWDAGPSVPPRGTAGVVAFRRSIYLFGGESQATGSVLGDVLRLARGARSWRRVAKLPVPRNYARAAVLDGAVYVVGGNRSAGASHSAAGSRVVERFTID